MGHCIDQTSIIGPTLIPIKASGVQIHPEIATPKAHPLIMCPPNQAVSGYVLNDISAVWRHQREAGDPAAISPAGLMNAENQRHLLALTLDLFASHLVGRLGSPT